MHLRQFFHRDYAPVYVPAALSLAGTLFYSASTGQPAFLLEQWSPLYLLTTPFIHAGLVHFLMNVLVLHLIGGQMLLPLLGQRRFVQLLAAGALGGHLLNNLLGEHPAIGLSAALMAVVACTLTPYGRAPMKLLLIHDLFRQLPPFQFRYLVAFIVLLDVCGILFGWQFFAHWGHLGGLVAGLGLGLLWFRRLPF